jgi:xanthine dehydrogenase YagS FAD-binding subunit
VTPFQLIDAKTVAEAVELMRHHAGRAQPLASGGDILGLLKDGVAGPTLPLPSVLINLASIVGLNDITLLEEGVRIGAMATLSQIARDGRLPPIFGEAIPRIASPQLRERTTIAGNLLQRPRCMYFRHPDITCYKKGGRGCPAVGGPPQAYPGALFPDLCHAGHPSDMAPVLIALGATAIISGTSGDRLVPIAKLYGDAGTNPLSEASLAPGELLNAIIVPHKKSSQAFEKVAPRKANEFSWASAAVAIEVDGDCITGFTAAVGGIAPGPFVCDDASAFCGHSITAIDASTTANKLLPITFQTDATLARASTARYALETALRRALDRAKA